MDKFEFNGVKYKKASEHQKEWGDKILSEFKLNGNEAILDLGCGVGVLTEKLSQLVPNGRVLGIDSSNGMIKEAQKIKKVNLAFLLQDINDIDYREEFDLIFSNATLHWIKDHKKLLFNCYRALKSKGSLRFNFAGSGNCANFFAIVREAMLEPDFRGFFRDFVWPWYMPEVKTYQKIVAASPFAKAKVWEENADRYFCNEKQMIAWIDQPSIVPFLKSIKDHKAQQQFRSFVVQEMIAKTKQADGRCFETFRRINVYAQKK